MLALLDSTIVPQKQRISPFKKSLTLSGRAIEDIPLPEGAIGYPEVLHEALLDEEVIEGLIRAGKPDE